MKKCYRNCKEECDRIKLATCIRYMGYSEYVLRKTISRSKVCSCGELKVKAIFRQENTMICTSCNESAMKIRRILVG